MTAEKSLDDYRAWPMFIISFLRLFCAGIFDRALQNYVYFHVGISESILGFISSAGAIAYIFAPIFGQIITSKLGVRKAFVLSCCASPILSGLQLLYFEPWFLITCYIFIGLSLGIFWPNCFNLLNTWQKVSSVEKSTKNFKVFNLSWNTGFILGLSVGFWWALTLSDYLAMIISWLLSLILIPFSLFIRNDSQTLSLSNEESILKEDSTSKESKNQNGHSNSNTPLIIYPILFSWVSIFFLASSKATFIFGYPVLLKSFNNPSYLTYLIQGSFQFAQLLGLTWTNSLKIYRRKLYSFFSISMVVIINFLIIVIGNIWYISIVVVTAGLFLGLIQGTAMKIMLDYGTAENTTKYSTMNEILVGMGFGITPIIAGYVAEVNLYAIFGFMMFFGLFTLIFLIYLTRNINSDKCILL